MTDLAALDEPPRELIYRRRIPLTRAARELWAARDLVLSLAERQVRTRYKQAVLGFGWALIQPLVLMLALTLVFDQVGDVESGAAPYVLFSYLGLLPWTFFAGSLTTGAVSILTNLALINKIACPREVFPLSAVGTATLDLGIALIPLGGLFLVTGYAPRGAAVYVPLLLLVQFVFTIGAVVLASVLTVYIRDVRNALPFIIQVGLFATPVAYGLEEIPASLRGLYSFVNPLGPVIDGYRRTVLEGLAPQWDLLGLGAAGALVVLVAGFWLFKRMEARIADVA